MPNRRPIPTRFEKRIVPDGDCWRWTGRLSSSGYGRFHTDEDPSGYAHRWSYEYHRAEIPDGLPLDHLCRNTWCVNPWHLEPVTNHVNILRGEGPSAVNARKTHCVRGHELVGLNLYTRPDTGTRQCRTCNRMIRRRTYQRTGK